ncbi:hypothetical protein [Methylobrevis albus]|uniref:Uncharacterized protein n=1 Tax=Methylobrevis albus TaxID=2793297 RepID=A0A931I2B7_9HYPH|nr:hypothetical protein [Methylobrevis albus]MBH0237598.1 hypothetical protein [Methylobrevis albus]
MRLSIASFLWVARAYDRPDQPAWQIDIDEIAEDLAEAAALGGQLARRRTLSMADAAGLGIDLAVIGAGIDAGLLGEAERLRRRVAELEEGIDSPAGAVAGTAVGAAG